MAFFVSIYSVPKRGHEPVENQDAFWPLLAPRKQFDAERSQDRTAPTLLAAVADGATEGMFGEIWSRILASRVDEAFPSCRIDKLLQNASLAWIRFKRRKASAGRPLTRLPAWLEEPGLEQGAFSTFAAVSLLEDQTWKAVAVGDSCLFHVRSGELLRHWPVLTSGDFAKPPYLLCSAQSSSSQLNDNTYSSSGQWSQGDSFFLMTDALACWFLKKCENGEKPWVPLTTVGVDGSFEELVKLWRESDGMRNDDVTLIRIEVR